ncbi:type II toxin-antitoxin system RelE/ParE family toxin [Sphingomonas sp. RB3P16]|uniref:type II toxin-antitoxin system RelE/ParE family toxin n=1 Tax=Parasphingomonas frigoris TaxID=3096163 RepID=UPI003FA79FC5
MRFSIETFGEAAAAQYLDMLEQTNQRLRKYFESGALVPKITPRVRSAAAGSHRIFYDRTGDVLTVRRVLHRAMRTRGRL